MSDNVSIVEQLEAVTNAFIAQLPLRADEIERQWFQVKREPANPQRWQDLYRLAHNLAGGGGTFGFSEITDAARIAADLLRTAHADCQQLTVPVEIEPLEQALRRLQELCRDPGGKGQTTYCPSPVVDGSVAFQVGLPLCRIAGSLCAPDQKSASHGGQGGILPAGRCAQGGNTGNLAVIYPGGYSAV